VPPEALERATWLKQSNKLTNKFGLTLGLRDASDRNNFVCIVSIFPDFVSNQRLRREEAEAELKRGVSAPYAYKLVDFFVNGGDAHVLKRSLDHIEKTRLRAIVGDMHLPIGV